MGSLGLVLMVSKFGVQIGGLGVTRQGGQGKKAVGRLGRLGLTDSRRGFGKPETRRDER